jgi:hypothetical protein
MNESQKPTWVGLDIAELKLWIFCSLSFPWSGCAEKGNYEEEDRTHWSKIMTRMKGGTGVEPSSRLFDAASSVKAFLWTASNPPLQVGDLGACAEALCSSLHALCTHSLNPYSPVESTERCNHERLVTIGLWQILAQCVASSHTRHNKSHLFIIYKDSLYWNNHYNDKQTDKTEGAVNHNKPI